MWKRVKQDLTALETISHLQTHFDAFSGDALKNIVAKGEIVHDMKFLLLPQFLHMSSDANTSKRVKERFDCS